MYPSQQNATDQTANFFWILCLIIGGFLAVWWFRKAWIITPIFWIRIHEIDLIGVVGGVWSVVASSLHLPHFNMHALEHLQHYMTHSSPKGVPFNLFAEINAYIGQWLRWPVAITLCLLAAVMHFFHTSSRFRKTYTMDNLKKLESENWPQIKPVLTLDLVKEDLDEGPWAMAKHPLNFCKENNLVSMKLQDGKETWSLSQGPAQRVFALQLGQLWKGVQALPIHMKALVVICLARAHRERKIANQLLSQIAGSAASGNLDFTGVEEQLQKLKDSKVLKCVEPRHAYVTTFMSTLLEIARADGVLATAEFLWLKPVDRRLWYVLNSVGRQTAVIEVSGVFSHWLAEKKLGRAFKVQMVKQAVKALEMTIQDTLYVPEGDSWHTINAA